MPRLELAGDRYWEITRSGTTLTIVSGRLGTAGRTTTKTTADEEAAEALLEHLLAEMEQRGYQPTEPGSAPTPARPVQPARKTEPRNPELEAAILKDPEDTAVYAVYADWLQGQGELRGELIAAQIAADAHDSAKARAAAGALLETHGWYFIGPLAHDPALTLSWRHGFIHSAEIEARNGGTARTLEQLLAHPSARFLVRIALELEPRDPYGPVDALARMAPASLRTFELFGRCEPDLAAVWRACPNLTQLEIAAHSYAMGAPVLRNVRRARFLGTHMSGPSIAAIASAPWPALERLDIYFGEGSAIFDDVRPLLERSDLPELTHLRLRGASFAGEICRALPASPLASQLTVIDLSKGDLAEADDLVALAAHRFERLKEIALPVTLAHARRIAPAVEKIAKTVIGAERIGAEHAITRLVHADEDEEYYDEIQE